MVLDDIVTQGRGNHPDQLVLELGGQLDLTHCRLLEAVEAARPGDDQLHRLGGDLAVAVADQLEKDVVALGGRMRFPEAVLLDAADEDVAEIGVAQYPDGGRYAVAVFVSGAGLPRADVDAALGRAAATAVGMLRDQR